jgi:predicted NBD/HSP70 family sugar kinase
MPSVTSTIASCSRATRTRRRNPRFHSAASPISSSTASRFRNGPTILSTARRDPLAQELFDDQARALGIALLCVNYLGDYDRLVIGGGVCDLVPTVRERYRDLAEAEYRRHALDGFRNLDRFEFSVCGDDAPVIGALATAMAQEI